jgi:hypothetical protein
MMADSKPLQLIQAATPVANTHTSGRTDFNHIGLPSVLSKYIFPTYRFFVGRSAVVPDSLFALIHTLLNQRTQAGGMVLSCGGLSITARILLTA